MMHAVVPRLLLVVGQAWGGEKGNAVVGLVVGRPGGAAVSELSGYCGRLPNRASEVLA